MTHLCCNKLQLSVFVRVDSALFNHMIQISVKLVLFSTILFYISICFIGKKNLIILFYFVTCNPELQPSGAESRRTQ
ncbi:hypothetical protein GDO81_023245 [Engystomops pustulosus]|uniref:Uncharacterized protein n=1 Tax=Engystomops pustulosus TaxID=76066 RepID=A0AAV6YW04_ENGPU|nr:hypothetical protein GDO81_023245 [Engystomops pustulosus]